MLPRDAGIPVRPRPPAAEPEVTELPFPNESPRLRPRVLEVSVGPGGVWEFDARDPSVHVLGGEEADGAQWLLLEVLELEVGAEFLACCCVDGWGGCWVALL